MRNLILLFFMLFATLQSVLASDLAKEQRWADQIVDSLIDGEAEWLQAGEQKFLAIYTEAEEETTKGMIVVHGTGVHPDWDQVVKPIRVDMATHGWNTLSIQMPILRNEAEYADYVPLYPEVPPRMKAAEDFLLEKGMTDIVIVSHSQGATMSSYYLSRNPSKAKAFVAIGMGATQKDSHLNSANALKSIHIPVFDMYGTEDLPGVLETSELRKQSAAHNANYEQQVFQDVTHFWDGKETVLLDAIKHWLDKTID
jgi:pimeloyl-ACP methyl ester carboxylesterase